MADKSTENKGKNAGSSSKPEEKQKRAKSTPSTPSELSTALQTLKTMPPITVKSVGGASHLIAQFPSPLHGRPTPYVATPQSGVVLKNQNHFPSARGNPPVDDSTTPLKVISDDRWNLIYNQANSLIYENTPKDTRVAVCKAAREEGMTRDLAVEVLIAEGDLSENLMDGNP